MLQSLGFYLCSFSPTPPPPHSTPLRSALYTSFPATFGWATRMIRSGIWRASKMLSSYKTIGTANYCKHANSRINVVKNCSDNAVEMKKTESVDRESKGTKIITEPFGMNSRKFEEEKAMDTKSLEKFESLVANLISMAQKIVELQTESLKLLEFLNEGFACHKETVKKWQYKQQKLLEDILAFAKNFSPGVDISSPGVSISPPEGKVLSKIPVLSKFSGLVVGILFMKQLIELIEFLVEHAEVGCGVLMGILLILVSLNRWIMKLYHVIVEYVNEYVNEVELEDIDSPF